MAEINKKLLDKIIGFQVDLRRLNAGERRKIINVLKDVEKGIKAELSEGELIDLSKKKIESVISRISEPISQAYSQIHESTQGMLDDLVELQLQVSAKDMESVFAGMGASLPPAGVVNRLTKDLIVQGNPLNDWWAKQEADTIFKVSSQIRTGIVSGETNQQIIRRLVGTKTIPGVITVARNNASAIVHTAIQTVSNDAQQAFYAANDDIIKSVTWFTAMDSHVCWSPDTLVTMADGLLVPIGQIKEGDYVTGGISGKPCKVLFSGRRKVESSVEIHYNDKIIGRSTYDHPVLTKSGWQEIGSVSLSADIREREVLCRNNKESESEIAAAQIECSKRQEICDKQGMEEIWGASLPSDIYCIQHGICDANRDRENQGSKNKISSWLQFNGWRRGCVGIAGRNIKRKWQKILKAIQGRSGIQEENEECCFNVGEKRIRNQEGFQCYAGRSGNNSKENKFGVERKDIESESRKSEDARQQGEAFEDNEGSLGNSGIQKQSQCCQTEKTERIERIKSSMGRKETSSHVGINEKAMARSFIQGEDTLNRYAKNNSGSEKESWTDASKKHDSGETCCDSRENSRAMGEKEGITTGSISGRIVNSETDVVILTVENDPTYIVGGGVIVHNCALCMARAGSEWSNDAEHKIISGNQSYAVPPIHINDRCVLIPKTVTFKELGIDLPEPPVGTRASNLGPIKADTTFKQYLEMVDKDQQDSMLGKGRAELFRDGKISLNQLLDGNGRELTLKELKSKYA